MDKNQHRDFVNVALNDISQKIVNMKETNVLKVEYIRTRFLAYDYVGY